MIPEEIKSLKVKVKPNSKNTEIISYNNGEATIHISAKPENNKANEELEKFLSKVTGKKAKIKSGFTSKRKLVLFDP